MSHKKSMDKEMRKYWEEKYKREVLFG